MGYIHMYTFRCLLIYCILSRLYCYITYILSRLYCYQKQDKEKRKELTVCLHWDSSIMSVYELIRASVTHEAAV